MHLNKSQRSRRNITLIVITLIPVLLVMYMIYGFSAQNSDLSNETSGGVVDMIINFFVPNYDNLPTEEQESLSGQITYIVRKTGHFSEFALLGFLLTLHLQAIHNVCHFRYRAALAFVLCALYAASDEFHQGFVDGRAPSIKDVSIDSAGALFGILLMMLIISLTLRYKTKRIVRAII